MNLETSATPPVWLIALLALPVLLALAVMYLGLALSGPHLKADIVLMYSAPLAVTLGTGSLAVWSWLENKRTIAIWIAAIVPALIMVSAMFLLGIGI